MNYVWTAVVSFLAGVVITWIFRQRAVNKAKALARAVGQRITSGAS